jgi:hypothetical protein
MKSSTAAIFTPESRDKQAAEYATSWGMDPTAHVDAERVADEGEEGASGDGDETAAAKADTRSEYERAYDELDDAKAAMTDANPATDDDDDDESSDGDKTTADSDGTNVSGSKTAKGFSK